MRALLKSRRFFTACQQAVDTQPPRSPGIMTMSSPALTAATAASLEISASDPVKTCVSPAISNAIGDH